MRLVLVTLGGVYKLACNYICVPHINITRPSFGEHLGRRRGVFNSPFSSREQGMGYLGSFFFGVCNGSAFQLSRLMVNVHRAACLKR